MSSYEPCGLGVCAANDGHEEPCAVASGWADEGELWAEVARLRDQRDALAARLAAVEALHRPTHPIFNWQSGLRYEDPCPDCHGKAGVHPCGCWSDVDTEYVCRECDHPKNGGSRRPTPWPCPTARAALATGTDQ